MKSEYRTRNQLSKFTSKSSLRRDLDGLCTDFRYQRWPHYWAVEYVTAGR
jgi:hypothetical protein